MNLEQEIKKELSIIKKDVQQIKQQGRVQHKWVPASWIMDLTGWDRVKMIAARRDGVIEFKEVKDKGRKIYKYNLASLPEIFIKKKPDASKAA